MPWGLKCKIQLETCEYNHHYVKAINMRINGNPELKLKNNTHLTSKY
jgi:hypothetical protein